ncbi:MAG: phosphoribosylformylglycinamidine synthase subunit PurQ [Candidatus Diapherotrites archaeon]|nr:phosphoribosylformylglycinamidine synthase subunit PurQ [Candidatus Diapherotrites archaeon]
MRMPVAHGEGNFTASPETLKQLSAADQVVFKYTKEGKPAAGEFPFNPNGSVQDIAGICDETGRVFGLMPHPERNVFFSQMDDWTLQRELLKRKGKKLPAEGMGMAVFRNAVNFFK